MGGVDGPVLLSSFLAASIEAVEIVALVVAVGAARSWRASLLGAGCALLLLAATIGALGPALESIPLRPVRLVVGSLLLVFGLGWMRKGLVLVSRDGWMAGGVGEEEVPSASSSGALDLTAFALSFKGVSLEGLEIAVVVVALGSGAGEFWPAALGAVAALVVLGALGALTYTLVARLPRRILQLGVGLVLATFGTFWAVEGAGGRWPGGEAALVGIAALYAATAAALLRMARRWRASAARAPAPAAALPSRLGPR
jgi:Ca2+/H+ antiporter, TMEM165/GDT1 family